MVPVDEVVELSRDHELEMRARRLVDRCITEMETILDRGSIDMKMQLIRTVTGSVVRTAHAQAEDDGMAKVRAELLAHQQHLVSALIPSREPVIEVQVPSSIPVDGDSFPSPAPTPRRRGTAKKPAVKAPAKKPVVKKKAGG